MSACFIRKHGGPEVLEIADLPRPKAEAGQVVIQVKAAGMNHLDTWVRRGMPGVTLPLPMILGSDAAGVIEAAGPGVAGVKPGDRVFVSPGLSCMRCIECCSGREPLCRDYGMLGEHTNGVQAEFVALPAANVMPLPDGLSFEEGAAFPLVFLTAWHMLAGRACLRLGEDVLVQARGGGVGTAGHPIAPPHGARVFTPLGSGRQAPRRRGPGAGAVSTRSSTVSFLSSASPTGIAPWPSAPCSARSS